MCNKDCVEGDYCPSCGLKWTVYSSSYYTNNVFSPVLKARHEYQRFINYQLCDKCHTPNYFGVKYCRNCGENMTLHAEDINRHGWVDLGLSVLWSTETMKGFYPWMDSKTELTDKWYVNISYENDGKDVASLKWGQKWRIPTKEEFEELINKCKWEKVIMPNSKKHALKVVGPNGNYIFLQVSGELGPGDWGNKAHLVKSDSLCCFWTSSIYTDEKLKIGFEDNVSKHFAFAFRYSGYPESEYKPKLTKKQNLEYSIENESKLNFCKEMSIFDCEERLSMMREHSRILDEKRRILNEMEDDYQERRKNEEFNMELRNELWLNTPISHIDSSINPPNNIMTPRLVFRPKCFGAAIRPVADKKWQGCL